ncbi:MAG: AEC family transporter [Planctomycetota bacterium]
MGLQSEVIVGAVAGVFGVIALGAFLRRVNWLTEAVDASLLKVMINVLFPCFIFSVLLGNPALEEFGNVWLPPVVGFGCTAMGFAAGAALAWTLGPKFGLDTAAKKRTFALIVGMFNYGFVPIPIVDALFTESDGGATLGVLLVHNVGVDLAMWSLGVMIVSGAMSWAGLKRLVNAPLLAIVGALVLNAIGLPSFAASSEGALKLVFDALAGGGGMVAACAIPTALILVGATVMDEFRKADLRQGWGVMAAGCGLRLGVLPVAFLALAWLLGPKALDVAGLELRRVIAIEASMPTAVFPVLLARLYGGDPGTAMRVALATSFVSLITIPLWLGFGLRWLGVG